MSLKEMKMIDWKEYIDKALTRLPGKKKASTLPQLSLQVPDTKGRLLRMRQNQCQNVKGKPNNVCPSSYLKR